MKDKIQEVKERLGEYWQNLDPRWRMVAMVLALGVTVFSIDNIFFRSDKKPEPEPFVSPAKRVSPAAERAINVPFGRQFEEDMLADIQRGQMQFQQRMQEQLKSQQQELEDLRQRSRMFDELEQYLQSPEGFTVPDPRQGSQARPAPNIPGQPGPEIQTGRQQGVEPPAPEPVRTMRWSGGISVAQNSWQPQTIEEQRIHRTVYMPSGSFAKATLLNGTSAKTALEGLGNPHIVKLRIDDLTVLPNDLKRNLDGCFVQASAHGDLADERVHLELATLSCLTHDGRGVIDQDVKGYVTASDGQKGIPGEVFAAFPSSLWRGALVSAIGGIGEFAANVSSQSTTSVTGAGVITEQGNVRFEDYVVGGLGTGVRRYTEDLSEFYSGLIRQQGPSIQILPGARVTIHFSTGTELKIREICNEEVEQCNDLS